LIVEDLDIDSVEVYSEEEGAIVYLSIIVVVRVNLKGGLAFQDQLAALSTGAAEVAAGCVNEILLVAALKGHDEHRLVVQLLQIL
jgi:hypothetical protein